MSLMIRSPGALTTVQDLGRTGHLAQGFSPCGAMDGHALRIANLLVGNRPGEAALEMTITGVTAEFGAPAVIALAGGDFGATLNGAAVPAYKALAVQAGDLLSCPMVRTGCRGYLAVAGGFSLPAAMGSCSTDLKCGIGGFQGRKLAAGDVLPLRKIRGTLPDMETRRYGPEAIEPGAVTVRVVSGPQDHMFTQAGLQAFFGTAYTIAPESDRMGIRLKGQAVESIDGVDIVSDGIPLGGIQVPASGQPIILMADRQTVGGYAKIATAAAVDLPLLAQARPGTELRFEAISVGRARRLWKRRQREYDRLGRLWGCPD